MQTVTLDRIRDALSRVRKLIPPSAVKESVFLQKKTGRKTFLKLENLNLSGSFKIRGASNAILQIDRHTLEKGVIAASAGNHAQGVAYTCKMLGAKARIFMPERTPLVKAEATRELGAEVIIGGATYDDAYQTAVQYQKDNGGVFVHPFNDPNVICGQGTIALEILEQVPDVGMVICSIGGGGLISGVAAAIKQQRPDVKVIGVQSAASPATAMSFTEGKIVSCPVGSTIADGIAVKQPGDFTFSMIQKYVDDVLAIDEEAIASAVMDLIERDHMLAEGAGAVSVAGLLQLTPEHFQDLGDRSVVCVVSGGNMDVNLLKRIIPHGLKYSGRLMRLAVRVQDRPGKLVELLQVISRTGANLQDVQHNRLFGVKGYEDVEVQVDLETINHQHQDEITLEMQRAGLKFSRLD